MTDAITAAQVVDAEIERYDALDVSAPAGLQALVDLVARVCGVPYAAVNIITSESQHQISLRLGGDDDVTVTVVPGPVAQVVEALLDNALAHGDGTISVTAARERSYDVVAVSDEGPRTAAPGVIHQVRGVGGGLSAISLLAESMGGQLLVDDTATTRYLLRLPRSGADDLLA